MNIRDRCWNSVNALFLLVFLVGCGAMHASQCSGDGRTAMQELLYFGTDTPSGHVTPEEWTQFLSGAPRLDSRGPFWVFGDTSPKRTRLARLAKSATRAESAGEG